MQKIAVLGAGSWGTALAASLAAKDYPVFLWSRRPEAAAKIIAAGENAQYLPGVKLPRDLQVSSDLGRAVSGAATVILSVPSHAVREIAAQLRGMLPDRTLLVNTAKGLEMQTLKRLSEVIAAELPEKKEQVAVLSGPSHAEEVGVGMPTAIVAAAQRKEVAEEIQDVFISPNLRVYTNPDLVGVELAGALKNVTALATGIAEGLGFGDNTKAALMTRGLAEIARLGVCLGAQPLTFAGLAGIGDLIVTCTSPHSRNRRAGMQLGQGRKLDQVLQDMGMVVEGVRTTFAAYQLSRDCGVEMPITEQVFRVLYEHHDPRQGVGKLMQRTRTHEVEEVVINYKDWAG